MTETILETQSLTKYFDTNKAVDGVSFKVKKGEVLGFLGPNGAGKSTTLRMLLGLIQPTDGEIKIFGRSLARERAFILSKVGSLIEKPDFYKYLSARTNLKMMARLSGIAIHKSKVDEVLEMVGLSKRANDFVKAYSHGMRQRLGLAAALIHDPEIIILDEPTTGLDPQGIIDIRNLILFLKGQGKTIILSSHILSEIELIADSLIIIAQGKVLEQGQVSKLLNQAERVVHLSVDKIEETKLLLNTMTIQYELDDHTNSFTIHCSDAVLKQVTFSLADKQISILNLNNSRRLEDFFMQLINNS